MMVNYKTVLPLDGDINDLYINLLLTDAGWQFKKKAGRERVNATCLTSITNAQTAYRST